MGDGGNKGHGRYASGPPLDPAAAPSTVPMGGRDFEAVSAAEPQTVPRGPVDPDAETSPRMAAKRLDGDGRGTVQLLTTTLEREPATERVQPATERVLRP